MNVLLTGGAGYIGSHACIALVEAGHTPVILDNFSNSQPAVLGRLQAITKQAVTCERGDVLDTEFVEVVLRKHAIGAVVHLAGAKAVGESVAHPLKYYRNNVAGTVSLMQAMESVGCGVFVFSSSATVYGEAASVPIREDFALSHTNPYGHSKLVIEQMLAAQATARPDWRVAVLRYFNPVGAHPSGLIGEDPKGVPNNLMPYIAQVATGQRAALQIFGDDYPTPDGTGVRDYIHVSDLAQGHVAALGALLQQGRNLTLNLGTGRGHSVLEVVRAFEQASGRKIAYTIAPRRPGDIAQCYADPSLAQAVLGWRASRSLEEMCIDTWRWQSGKDTIAP
ncbi:UDP-glucose 4-epimerase GalE [Caenimonas koreensis DSM 17982]|uniref:UDP-glucose 4-epimerase n=1 Tax=Caenimonas koreensis DSM 17982 TaxID=1121255 RepID=A0A844AQI0_9BURK|nr:UDP-glucose 4-epimerase GalE [Caenimonas koreensis]MRD46425.1 UDP-glucose 4-epimerase GalE [Caenimonas koreensis DSM 17982]